MQHLNTLWQVVNTAAAFRELTHQNQIYRFPVSGTITFYLQADSAEVYVVRWDKPMLEVNARLQNAFAWRVATDQDAAGVYFVARRRPLVGQLGKAFFEVYLPHDTYLVFKLTNGQVRLSNVTGTLHIAPPERSAPPEHLPASERAALPGPVEVPQLNEG